MPDEIKPVQEGSRWRYAKPSSDEVAEWFKTVPLDEGMRHEDYISGVVLIPAKEKVDRMRPDGNGTEEVRELTFTPYVRVDTRIAYFRRLAELRDCIAVIEPVEVPRVAAGAVGNGHLPDGFFFIVLGEDPMQERFLGCQMRVALYDRRDYVAEDRATEPLREGIGTKTVTGNTDINAMARAETGAIGRALGVAGILVVGTGVATAEDMSEHTNAQPGQGAALPPTREEENPEALMERLMDLQRRLKPHAEQWAAFCAVWKQRSEAAGWPTIGDAPPEVQQGLATRMAELIREAEGRELPKYGGPADSSSTEAPQ